MDINEKIESYLSEAKKEKKTEKKEEKKSSPKKKEAKSDDKIYTYAEWAKMAKEQGYVIREIKPGIFQAADGKGNTLKYDSKKVKNSLSEAKKFEDSSEATAYFDSIKSMINSAAVLQWCKATDKNYGTKCESLLANLETAFNKLESELESAS